MDSLPHELHCAIASHLEEYIDLATYRLVNKRSALIGAELLFEVFTCRPVTESLERMSHILTSKYARYVTTIDYIGRPLSPPKPHPFSNTEVEAFGKVLVGFGKRLKEVNASHLSFFTFSPRIFEADEKLFDACANLTTLHLSFDHHSTHRGTVHRDAEMYLGLRTFLDGLHGLHDLGLVFSNEDFWRREHVLQDVISDEHVWPHLKRLELGYLHMRERDLVTLLRNHKMTLECAHLDFVVLVEEGARWENVLEVLKEIENLNHVDVEKEVKEEGVIHANGQANGNVLEWNVKGFEGREVLIRTNLTKTVLGKMLEVGG